MVPAHGSRGGPCLTRPTASSPSPARVWRNTAAKRPCSVACSRASTTPDAPTSTGRKWAPLASLSVALLADWSNRIPPLPTATTAAESAGASQPAAASSNKSDGLDPFLYCYLQNLIMFVLAACNGTLAPPPHASIARHYANYWKYKIHI